jgi:hypothetical protein
VKLSTDLHQLNRRIGKSVVLVDHVPFIIYQFTLDIFRSAGNRAGMDNLNGRTLT